MTQLALLSTRTTPATRSECEDGPRPCPFTACRHHLWAEDERPGRPWDGKRPPPVVRQHSSETCALDVAHQQERRDSRGLLPRDVVGEHLGVTGERARQIEEAALEKLRSHGIDLERVLEVSDEDEERTRRGRVRLPVVSSQLKLI